MYFLYTKGVVIMPIIFFSLTVLGTYALIIVSLFHLITLTTIFKCTTSVLFLLTAWITYKKNPHAPLFFGLIFTGLFFSFLGDAFLAFDSNKQGLLFILGVASFAIGHIMYILGYCKQTKLQKQDFLIFLCFLIPTLLAILLIDFDFKGMKSLVIIYAFIISLMVAKSFSMRIYYTQNRFSTNCLIAGSTLFFISDWLLLFLFFYPGAPSILQQYNWLLYYLGQALLAISFSLGTLDNPKQLAAHSTSY